ncbi:glutamate synthase-related protein [Alicyclobacillus ferrooxydans]|uniref:Glutamate synthase n=1 Tax=Alicyclobacillus ferrooxydans TaxID=471514 RepID=A0A0P9CI88_9BACL|nr:glutamate synthase [Alicyclobacillus ferrooxydans]
MLMDREQDACGIFSCVHRQGIASHKPIRMGVDALKAMKHRAGYVAEEGDGCGLMLDIPRGLWADWLNEAGIDASVVRNDTFAVVHVLHDSRQSEFTAQTLARRLEEASANVLLVRQGETFNGALGPSASREKPVFYQAAFEAGSKNLMQVKRFLEQTPGVHVASCSTDIVVYKVVGDGDTLIAYYGDLQNPRFESCFVMAHTRYSTNTQTTFSRVQPFATLGHNGEINTIARFYSEAGMAGMTLNPDSSDSQMVSEVVESLTEERGWTLFETAEMLFPPIVNEIKQMQSDLADLYMFYRAMWGPFSQGPAAVMMRAGKEAVFAVDALGLRPMWLIKTPEFYCFSSEQGIVPPNTWAADPQPLAPGEKIGIQMAEGGVRLLSYPQLQREVLSRAKKRYSLTGERRTIHFAGSYEERDVASPYWNQKRSAMVRAAAFGWREDDVKQLEAEVNTGAEPIRSIGYDGPMAALDTGLTLLSDYLQETVAVVTNPAIDREREIEHFSTRMIVGKRPSMDGVYHDAPRLELQSPLLFDWLPESLDVPREAIQTLANRYGTMTYEEALAGLHTTPNGTAEILIHRQKGESTEAALSRLRRIAVEAVQAGAHAIVLDDRLQFSRGMHLDPFLALAAVHKALQRSPGKDCGAEHLRRRTSIIVRSAGIRNLHDIMVAVGLGAEGVVPYLMWELAAEKAGVTGVENMYAALCKGIEKVISTIGIHELRGYERLFSAIGLSKEVADVLGVPCFYGSERSGCTLEILDQNAIRRQELYDEADERAAMKLRVFQIYPRIWKAAGAVAEGGISYHEYYERLASFEQDNPVNLKHLLGIKLPEKSDVQPENVDTTIDGHSYPILISSMSFGSQGETAYRAYAEAAYRMNIVAMNGEGGEIKDILNTYPKNRGRQVASGRFGVNAELCNGAYVLEIKIGQGAKPGEGGHLPGSKVTELVANARNAAPGIDLISPSNNHDIYSIEDLAQVIYELRAVNPTARIAVKVPVVPNIGTIAIGIVKAGADIVELSGFDGGTGAARAHALRRVGLPVEIGIHKVHTALSEAGIRHLAEIWADGGMKSGVDAMKAILLGANRVGFGTMAMVALGCTICRACHKDTCHVGIATQMTTMEEAAEKGVAKFTPREFDTAVENLQRFFTAVGEHIRELTALLGAVRTQDLVGRRDLLEQLSGHDRIDLSSIVHFDEQYSGSGTHVEYRESAFASGIIVEAEVSSLSRAVGENSIAGPSSLTPWKTARGSRFTAPMAPLKAGKPGDIPSIRPVERVVGTWQSGELARSGAKADAREVLEHPDVAGAGFAAYHLQGQYTVAHGGAQDGTAKCSIGGRVVVLKTRGANGNWVGGSVGKGLAYGAQHGLIIVQGNADARAGIRLSGADLVIGGQVKAPLDDTLGWVGARSNLKGFAFEYMTAGRAVVLGDPGPWMCSGMTGGSVYVRYAPSLGLTEQALRKRIAKGAKVRLSILDAQGELDVTDLLWAYHRELRQSGQNDAAQEIVPLLKNPSEHFRMIRPSSGQTDQDIATE